jgi:hypothetical protein
VLLCELCVAVRVLVGSFGMMAHINSFSLYSLQHLCPALNTFISFITCAMIYCDGNEGEEPADSGKNEPCHEFEGDAV